LIRWVHRLDQLFRPARSVGIVEITVDTCTRTVRSRFVLFLAVVVVVFSIPAAVAAAPGTPSGLVPTPGDQQVVLTWSAVTASPVVSTYNLEFSSNGGTTWTQVIRSASTAVTYTFTGLTNGTEYMFRLSAVNSDGTGPRSTVVNATPFVVPLPNDPATFSACPAGVIPVAGFTDITSTYVDCIAYYGITRGTTATSYSPSSPVTRWQMALFLTRTAKLAEVSLGTGADQGFTDIAGKSSEIQTAINQIRQLGVSVGKTATTFAPDDNVTREEMALFVSRLLQKAAAGPGGHTELGSGSSLYRVIKSNDTDHNFTDLGQAYLWETHLAIINLWNLGVTDVQASATYGPRALMTRKAMATLVANSLAHTNVRPASLVLQASAYSVENGTAVEFSVTHRTSGFGPIVGSHVDSFKFDHSISATVTRFDSAGGCTSNILATSVGSARCTVDSSDPKTDSDGNLAIFSEVPPYTNNLDVWAWTTAPTSVYDNDIHATTASKITINSHL